MGVVVWGTTSILKQRPHGRCFIANLFFFFGERAIL